MLSPNRFMAYVVGFTVLFMFVDARFKITDHFEQGIKEKVELKVKQQHDCLAKMESMAAQEKTAFENAREGECPSLLAYFMAVAKFENDYKELLEQNCAENENRTARLAILTAKEKQTRTMTFALHHNCCWAIESLLQALESAKGEVPDKEAAIEFYRSILEKNCDVDSEDKNKIIPQINADTIPV